MSTLKQFFKNPETFIGIVTAFAFLLIFFCVWMTAYNGVSDRADHLKIGLVNEDDEFGASIKEELTKNLPFEIKTYDSINTAQNQMNEKKLDMVMLIPSDFSDSLKSREKPELEFYINQANASMAKQMMEGTAKEITETVNENVYTINKGMINSSLAEQINSTVPAGNAKQVSNMIIDRIETLDNQLIQSSIGKTNDAKGFEVTMVPMMIVLASFVGSIIMSLNINVVSNKLKVNFNKWSILSSRILINLSASVFLAIITLILLAVFNIHLNTNLLETGIFQVLVYFSFLSLTQMFVIVFGPGGMLFNIIALSIQLVTSGVIVPKLMLSDFYQALGHYLPATYAANGYYTVIFGGESLTSDMLLLVLISGVTTTVAILKIVMEKNIPKSSSTTQQATG